MTGSTLVVLFNTDRKRATGDALGNDFAVVATEHGVELARLDGDASLNVIPAESPSPRLKGGVVSLTLMLADGSPDTKIDTSVQLSFGGGLLEPLAGGKVWKLPASLNGKPAVLKITLSSAGVTLLSRSYPVKID